MSHLSLDLSFSSTGYCVFSRDGKLVKKGKIVPDQELDKYTKIHYVVGRVKELFREVDDLVIEDVYVGKNPRSVIWLARLSGGVIFSWMDKKYKKPVLYPAIEARPLAGIGGHSHKVEVQLFVLKKYRTIPYSRIKKYKQEFLSYSKLYGSKQISKSQRDYKREKLSLRIERETGLGNDEADSIILGLAFANALRKRQR